MAMFDGRHYLSELGMRRAANMSRVMPSVIRSRHGAYLDRRYREHEQHHNDGVNRLVVRFAREGVEAVAGWRGEDQRPRSDPGTAGPAGAGERGRPGSGYPLHRVRADGGGAPRRGPQAGSYHRMAATGRAAAHVDRHARKGAGRAGERRGHGVEQGRRSGGAPLPRLAATESTEVDRRHPFVPRHRANRRRQVHRVFPGTRGFAVRSDPSGSVLYGEFGSDKNLTKHRHGD